MAGRRAPSDRPAAIRFIAFHDRQLCRVVSSCGAGRGTFLHRVGPPQRSPRLQPSAPRKLWAAFVTFAISYVMLAGRIVAAGTIEIGWSNAFPNSRIFPTSPLSMTLGRDPSTGFVAPSDHLPSMTLTKIGTVAGLPSISNVHLAARRPEVGDPLRPDFDFAVTCTKPASTDRLAEPVETVYGSLEAIGGPAARESHQRDRHDRIVVGGAVGFRFERCGLARSTGTTFTVSG